MFSSHIPGYHIIQKFRCEEDQIYSSRIYKPGSGIGILIKQGISYNLLEWACWQDQILTAIIFESNLKIFGAQNLKGLIIISVYRSQEEKDKKVFYDKLKDILDRIQTRYQHDRVLIGGDFNDQNPPKNLKYTEQRYSGKFTRFNTCGFQNTRIDYFYSNFDMKAGSMTFLKPEKDFNESSHLRNRIQSDHLAIITSVNM